MPQRSIAGVPTSLTHRSVKRCTELLHSWRGRSWAAPLEDRAKPLLSNPISELAAVQRALAGDVAAQDELIEHLACLPAMVRIKNRRIGSPLQPHDIDDAIQNVLLAVWRKLAMFDGRVPLHRWAYGFVVIEIARAIERRGRRGERQLEEEHEVSASTLGSAADLERVLVAMARLEEPEQSILRERLLDEASFDDIARRHHLPVNTIRTKYYRSLHQLRGIVARAEATSEGGS